MKRFLVLLLSILLSSHILVYAAVDTGGLGQPFRIPVLKSTGEASMTRVAQGDLWERDPLDRKVLYSRMEMIEPEDRSRLRGAKDISIYAKNSPSVALIVTNEAIGSGSVISKDGEIITNWHVVEGYEQVAVIFKPKVEGEEIAEKDIYRATVERIDEVSDLALIRVTSPPKGLRPLALGQDSLVQVGADVHAIGHPTGESWTYTKGIVSQIRKNYEWTTQTSKQHKANVIQTQTPINPGNSGGPLLSDAGRLIGVNSFKAQGEALNFAVSIGEVKRFLDSKESRYAAAAVPSGVGSTAACEEPVSLGEQENPEEKRIEVYIDVDCDGEADAQLQIPYDDSKPLVLAIDNDGNGRIDEVIMDINRDDKWDYSLLDTDGDGEQDLIGYHTDGTARASRYAQYDEKLIE